MGASPDKVGPAGESLTSREKHGDKTPRFDLKVEFCRARPRGECLGGWSAELERFSEVYAFIAETNFVESKA